MKIEAEFVGGSRDGQIVVIEDKPCIRIGRRSDNDLVFDPYKDLDVSGYHAEIRREAGGYLLCDLGSSNGTFVDDVRVERLRLATGHQMRFGPAGPGLRIRFLADEPTLPSAPMPPVGSGAQAAMPPSRSDAIAPSASLPAGVSPTGPTVDEHKVGSRTVAVMIESALRQSRDGGKGSMGRSTIFLRSMINQAVTRSTRRFKVITAVLLCLLVGGVGGVLVLRYLEKKEAALEQGALRAEMTRLLQQQKGASAAEKQELAAKIEKLNQALAGRSAVHSGKEIVKRNLQAIFLMAADHPVEGGKGYCTAFAIKPRLLATNAHCVLALEAMKSQGLSSYMVMNRDPSQKRRIVKVTHHPEYHKPESSVSKDVGLVMVDSDLPVTVQVADLSALRALEVGDVMYTYGFPGRLANVSSPEATLVQGIIGRITQLDGRIGSFEESRLIQHSAFTSGGTSGSPIFNELGLVIAVNAGGYVEPGSMQVMDPVTGRIGKLMVAKQLAGYNFAIRIDTLKELMASLGE